MTGYTVTIERMHRGKREKHSFNVANPHQSIARKQAELKSGFVKILKVEPKQDCSRVGKPKHYNTVYGARHRPGEVDKRIRF